MESRNDWMMTLRWSTENIRWNSMAQRSPDPRNHIRTGNQANVSLKSIFFFEVKYSGNLNSFFNVTRLLELELGIWRCYSPILVETLLRAFFRYDHTNPFDSRAAHFKWLPFWCKECCDCNMHVILRVQKIRRREIPFSKATWPRGISMRKGALSLARLSHLEQKSDSPSLVNFLQSIHPILASIAAFALSRHVFPHCGYIFPSMTTLGLLLQY